MNDIEKVHYDMLINAFDKEMSDDRASQKDRFLPAFDKVAKQLSKLNFDSAQVDVGTKKGLFEIYLYWTKYDILLNIHKKLEWVDNFVFFAIDRHHRALVIDGANLKVIVKKMKEIENDFEKLQEIKIKMDKQWEKKSQELLSQL